MGGCRRDISIVKMWFWQRNFAANFEWAAWLLNKWHRARFQKFVVHLAWIRLWIWFWRFARGNRLWKSLKYLLLNFITPSKDRHGHLSHSVLSRFQFPSLSLLIQRYNDKEWENYKENARSNSFEVVLGCSEWKAEPKPIDPLLFEHHQSSQCIHASCGCLILVTVESSQ